METSATFYIDTAGELRQFCDRLAGAGHVGLDTEFLREKTYYARPCLLQVSGHDLIACIDPLAIEDLGPLRERLFDPSVIKLMHACGQDLEILLQLFDGIPGPIFDTQVAAAFCGHGDQVSYGALVETLTGVVLDKAHTRARWCQRPLSEAEIHYAEDDVRYLEDLYHLLNEELGHRGYRSWFQAEMDRLIDTAALEIDNSAAWQRVGAIRNLSGRAMQVARELAAWREEVAQQRDKPRRWIMPDALIVALAQAQPTDMQALATVEGMTDGLLRHRGKQLLAVIADAAIGEILPDLPRSGRPDAREKALCKQLARLLDEKAQELDIPPSLLAPRRDLMALVQGRRDLAVLEGWRHEVIGGELLDYLETGAQ